jgi:hypothetical protein
VALKSYFFIDMDQVPLFSSAPRSYEGCSKYRKGMMMEFEEENSGKRSLI